MNVIQIPTMFAKDSRQNTDGETFLRQVLRATEVISEAADMLQASPAGLAAKLAIITRLEICNEVLLGAAHDYQRELRRELSRKIEPDKV